MKKCLKLPLGIRMSLCLIFFIHLVIPVQLASATPLQNLHWFDRFLKKDQKIIVVDAGHGGSDPGSTKGVLLEKDINLKIAIELKKQLEKKGYRVVMTRQDDQSLSLSQRAKLANQSKGDLLVSIHQNSFKDGAVHGIEVYYNDQKETKDQLLAQFIQESLIEITNASDRKVRIYNELLVIREARMPACLIESAYLSNEDERNLIQTKKYQDKVVQGIIEGIQKFFNEKAATN